jgi:putative FmdB family regulatory protein
MTYINRCPTCGVDFEWLAPRFTTPDPDCRKCGGPTERQVTAPAIVWTKPMGAYADPNSENYYQQQKAGGHWAMETDKATGAVSKVFIDSPQKQSDYCRRNGLIDPKNLPNNISVAKDGKSFEKNNVSEI